MDYQPSDSLTSFTGRRRMRILRERRQAQRLGNVDDSLYVPRGCQRGLFGRLTRMKEYSWSHVARG
ncbi:hypothetical protein Csa_002560, partial [Cucumis sativus]